MENFSLPVNTEPFIFAILSFSQGETKNLIEVNNTKMINKKKKSHQDNFRMPTQMKPFGPTSHCALTIKTGHDLHACPGALVFSKGLAT